MGVSNPYAKYKTTEVTTASPARLVVLLYEGAVKHIVKGKAHYERPGEHDEGTRSLLRAMQIVTELLGVLNPGASPDLANDLARLYSYVIDLLSRSLQERDPQPLDEAAKIMSELGSAWNEISRSAA